MFDILDGYGIEIFQGVSLFMILIYQYIMLQYQYYVLVLEEEVEEEKLYFNSPLHFISIHFKI